jgi:site-specific DNA recombinase
VKNATTKPVRCAIYTRVSSGHGLEQDFNSLDAQHDAAQAYIRSQAHAGWTLIRTRYDDGGYSGGSTERPALQRLLADVRGRKVGVIVVYKVDGHLEKLNDEFCSGHFGINSRRSLGDVTTPGIARK